MAARRERQGSTGAATHRQFVWRLRSGPVLVRLAMLVTRMRVIYFDSAWTHAGVQAPFTSGEAGVVWIEPTGDVETDTRMRICTAARMGQGIRLRV